MDGEDVLRSISIHSLTCCRRKAIEARGLNSTGTAHKAAFAVESDAYNNSTSRVSSPAAVLVTITCSQLVSSILVDLHQSVLAAFEPPGKLTRTRNCMMQHAMPFHNRPVMDPLSSRTLSAPAFELDLMRTAIMSPAASCRKYTEPKLWL